MVEPCLAEITAASLIGYVSISFEQLDSDIFAQCSWQHCSSSVRLEGDHEQQFLSLGPDSQLA